MTTIKYPNVSVQLTDEDGSAFAIVGRVVTALHGAGASADEVKAFRDEAMSSDYHHMLQTVMERVHAH